jgi:histidine phosphotransfer protein HptB
MMTDEKHVGTCIYSTLGADPDLAEIVAMFVDEMPARVVTLTRHFDNKDWESLRQAAHQLKGAAGSYGFEPISPSAGRVEAAVRNNEAEERIHEAVVELVNLCNSARCGQPQ